MASSSWASYTLLKWASRRYFVAKSASLRLRSLAVLLTIADPVGLPGLLLQKQSIAMDAFWLA